MKYNTIGVITLLLFGMVIAMTGIVWSDQPVPAVPETQTLGTVTIADVDGLAMETDAGVWTLTKDPQTIYSYEVGGTSSLESATMINSVLQAAGGSLVYHDIGGGNFQWDQMNIPQSMLNVIPPYDTLTFQELAVFMGGASPVIIGSGIHTGALDPGQVQYTTAYDANIVAQAGHTVFTKSMNLDTRNKVIGQSNINAQTGLTFIATADGGNVVGSENLMIDGSGNTTSASDRMLCPFSSQPVDVIPAYCNIVQAGSKYDLTVGSVTTNANDRFVGSDATNPVALNYAINVKPYGTSQGQILASGSTMAYIKAHIQEARGYNNVTFYDVVGLPHTLPGAPIKAEDLTYNEQSSAQGTITAFNKVIAYQSGKSLL